MWLHLLRSLLTVWANTEAEYSTSSSSVSHGRVHRSTHSHTIYSAFSFIFAFIFIFSLLCTALILLISVSRRALNARAQRQRNSSRRLVSTYPQLQVSASDVVTDTVATLPPSYCEAVAAPPAYSSIHTRPTASANTQLGVTSVTTASESQSAHESDNLLSQPL